MLCEEKVSGVWSAEGIVLYQHWCSMIKFLMQKMNVLDTGSCFAQCNRLYFYHFRGTLEKKAWIEVLWFKEVSWKYQKIHFLHSGSGILPYILCESGGHLVVKYKIPSPLCSLKMTP